MDSAHWNQVSDVHAVDCEYLTFLMQQAGYPAAKVQSFSPTNDVGPSYGGGGMLVRFSLSYDGPHDAEAPESIVLKQIGQHPNHPGDTFGFRREADCYVHGLFDNLPGRLCVPQAYAAVVQTDAEQAWIWMEDMGKAFDVAWSAEALIQHTRDIAALHALWWERRDALTAMPFLLRRGLTMYYGGPFTQNWEQHFAAIAGHPRANEIEQVFTPERQLLLKKLLSLVTDICQQLERLPQTLLHQDVYPPNLGRSGERTVLIDWANAGPGTPGSELAVTLAQGFEFVAADIGSVRDGQLFKEQLLEAYRANLQAYGVHLDFSDLEAGFELACCLRPAHALGGYILPGLLLEHCPGGGARDLSDLNRYLFLSECFFHLLQKVLKRL